MREAWRLIPTFCLMVVILVAPFAGTLSIYRTAMFALMAHTLACCWSRRPALARGVGKVLVLGTLFTAWSLLAACFGIDPAYSIRRWQSEHLYAFLFFAAILINPCGLRVNFLIWSGIASVGFIALGMAMDPFAMGEFVATSKKSFKILQVAYTKGFSSDIIWITSHLILVYWIAMAAVLRGGLRRPAFYGGLAAAIAGCWVVGSTYQIMPFFIIATMTMTFICLILREHFGRRGIWAALLVIVATGAALGYRDVALHPEKKIFPGIAQLLSTGKTKNAHIQSRINGIRWAVSKCGERPWLGWGPGREILRKVEPSVFDITERDTANNPEDHPPIGHLHCQFPDLLIRVGIPGLALYLLFLASVYLQAWRSRPWQPKSAQNPAACFQLAAAVGMAFMLARLLTETYPASSVAAQYWMVLALVARNWRTYKDSETLANGVDDPLLVSHAERGT